MKRETEQGEKIKVTPITKNHKNYIIIRGTCWNTNKTWNSWHKVQNFFWSRHDIFPSLRRRPRYEMSVRHMLYSVKKMFAFYIKVEYNLQFSLFVMLRENDHVILFFCILFCILYIYRSLVLYNYCSTKC